MIEETEYIRTSRFIEASNYAAYLHRDQKRKGTSILYISHLFAVASLVMEANGSEDEVIAALLHDAVEDQGGLETLEEIRKRFGDKVADIVEGCTDDAPPSGQPKKPWIERKVAYLNHLRQASPEVKKVSNADKLHNARAILSDYQEMGDCLWERFNASKDDILRYYRDLAHILAPVVNNKPLGDQLAHVVKTLNELAYLKNPEIESCPELSEGTVIVRLFEKGVPGGEFDIVDGVALSNGEFSFSGYCSEGSAWYYDSYDYGCHLTAENTRLMLTQLIKDKFENKDAYVDFLSWLVTHKIEYSVSE